MDWSTIRPTVKWSIRPERQQICDEEEAEVRYKANRLQLTTIELRQNVYGSPIRTPGSVSRSTNLFAILSPFVRIDTRTTAS
jgi:hypothetical protein